MKKNTLADKAAGIGENLVVKDRKDGPPRTAGGTMLALREVLSDDKVELDQLKKRLEEAESAKAVTKLPLSRLHKVSGRQRILTAEQYSELKENLRHNLLDSPITVTVRADGDWEIVSGHNRVDIYAELGRIEIDAIIKPYTQEEASRLSFYSNLLHPSLSDYGKYLGFKQRMYETSKDQAGLSVESGLSKDVISRIMSFDRLPEEAQEFIRENPTIKLGANAASDFATLAEQGRAAQVTEAIKAIVTNGITQLAALELAKKNTQTAKKPDRPTPIKIRDGKTVFAEIIGVGKNIRISVVREEDRGLLEAEIETVIRKFMNDRKEKN